MAHKYEEPPAYGMGSPPPQAPQPAYHNNAYGSPYGSPSPAPAGPYGGPPPAGQYYPQQGPQMGYYQQPPPQQGYYGGQQQPGGYYAPQGHYQDNRRGNPGCMEALLASLACCCCLECLLF